MRVHIDPGLKFHAGVAWLDLSKVRYRTVLRRLTLSSKELS
jgi:hypothetical protein